MRYILLSGVALFIFFFNIYMTAHLILENESLETRCMAWLEEDEL